MNFLFNIPLVEWVITSWFVLLIGGLVYLVVHITQSLDYTVKSKWGVFILWLVWVCFGTLFMLNY